jgi:hypothetical protein
VILAQRSRRLEERTTPPSPIGTVNYWFEIVVKANAFTAEREKGLGEAKALLQFCCVASRAGFCFLLHGRDSHRESGVFSVVSPLSPVESSVPSGAQ